MDVAEMIDELLRVRHPSDLVDTEGDGQAIVDLLRRYGHLDPTEMHRFNQLGTETRVVTGSMVAPAPIEDIQAVVADAGGRELKSVEIAPGVLWPDHGMVVVDPMDMDIEEIRAKREARIEAEMEALEVEPDDGRIDYGPQFDEGDEPDPNQPGVGGHRRTELTLLGTTDARVWAHEFCRIFDGRTITAVTHPNDDVDEGTMVAWFAPAIEMGRNVPVGNMIPEE